ncbi:pilus assembly protein TadE [Bifidobacterium primatium]|uniref:Pilus assembly protein TadE n=1 Tax=Bifidobacterium primatium TaxID=2045438 RepID=A0A2M9H6I2_9BIFI|nr:Rv3654c family TadE-like protein [Bifidobacterium primatium]PJM72406.1 pilus assembly protein TadE [Bifidobacterium primatium]
MNGRRNGSRRRGGNRRRGEGRRCGVNPRCDGLEGNPLRQSDRGSGTVIGVGLVTAAAVLLSAILAVGNVLYCKSVAQTAADHAALAAATAHYESLGDPCAKAGGVASSNRARLAECSIMGEDVVVGASVTTRVPFVGEVTMRAKAGPKDCR